MQLVSILGGLIMYCLGISGDTVPPLRMHSCPEICKHFAAHGLNLPVNIAPHVPFLAQIRAVCWPDLDQLRCAACLP